nr:TonB-dependent receptor [uncultured Sphingorhabdus sp.]
MKSRFQLATSAVALTICSFSNAAFAQSTGSVDFEEEVIVVSGSRSQDVAGIQAPDSTKAKAVLTQELIERQNPGQTILDTINVIPGVNFQNNDAYGSSGGTLNIRGFDSSRISLTFDGIPLNDSGNYAIYSNQQLDPELIEQVNVNLGTTDVDSPTASAVGGTVNYRTLTPTEDFGVKLSASAGQFDFRRFFGMVNTGSLTSFGTRAFFSASKATNDNPFNNYGVVDKQQYNGKIYQPIGSDGDFISIAGNYNQNRNNFFGSLPLRNDVGRVVGALSTNRYPANNKEREYLINFPCSAIVTPVAGSAQSATTCGTEFDRRYNPSNTGSIRGASKFTLTEKLTLTVDPSYQYVKANGGGTVTAREARRDIDPTGGAANCTTVTTGAGVNCQAGYLSGAPYFGRDLNGDGDILDQFTMMAPSQTQTHRLGVISSLRYEINDDHSVRLAYTFDRARHRQTGQVGLLDATGEPLDVFPVNKPELAANGVALQKRDRLSYAILQQISSEYRGEFMDNNLVVTAGVRAPFFKRDLTNNCFTSSAGGFQECFGDAAQNTLNAGLNPTQAGPQNRVFKYDKVLPNVGFNYKFTPELSMFASFAQGLSVPGTDSLYNAFFFPITTARARPAPETTDSVDVGLRYRSGNIQAQLSGWLTKFQNRSASAYDPELDQNVYRNLGNVDKYGVDGSVSYQPIPELAVYVFGSYLKSEIKNNLAIGENADGTAVFAATAGQREGGSPKYSFGGTLRGELGPVELGITGKRTGPRNIFDTGAATYTGTFIPTGAVPSGTLGTTARTEIFGKSAPAYWLVNLDASIDLDFAGLNDTRFQLNVYNLFDQFYVGGFGGGLAQSATYSRTTGVATYGSPGFVQIGAPRTVSGTLTFKF